jgi:hypothetical protein
MRVSVLRQLAAIVWAAAAEELAVRLEVALDDDVKLLALMIDERASSWRRSKIHPRAPGAAGRAPRHKWRLGDGPG